MTNTHISWPLRVLALSRHGWWGALLWLLWILPANAVELRVAVRKSVQQVQIGTSTSGVVRDSRGQAVMQLPELQPITVDAYRGQL